MSSTSKPRHPHSLEEPKRDVESFPLHRNLRWGVGWGLAFATFFSLLVGLMATLRGSTVYEDLGGLTTWQIVAFYYGAGIAGGAVVGVLRPIQHYYWGKYVTAYVTLFLVYGGGTAVFFPMMAKDDPGLPLRAMIFLWALLCLVLAPIYVRITRNW